MDDVSSPLPTDGKVFPWILEHLLAYPGTYEVPLRTMYTLNVRSQNEQQHNVSRPPIPGNAFRRPSTDSHEEQQPYYIAAVAAANLRSNLSTVIAHQPSQPTSLPPSFITSFVRQTWGDKLDQVDFLQALTSLDYLRDLDIRRRREVLAALEKLGVHGSDLREEHRLAKNYPGVVRWIVDMEEKERQVETLYTQVYTGLRRWTMLNELSIVPYNKTNCIAMLNTLYPPEFPDSVQITQPTAHITPQVVSQQRSGFFRYIHNVEKSGTSILKAIYEQQRYPDDQSGYPRTRDYLDQYLRVATSIIDECYEITGNQSARSSASSTSFGSTSFPSYRHTAAPFEDFRRKFDSGISFGTANSSARNSAGSHVTRPSTSSSLSTHSRVASNTQKRLPEKPLPIPTDEEDNDPTPVKPAGTKLERIARELRRMRSKSNGRSQSRPRVAEDEPIPDLPTPAKERTLRFKRSLRSMRGVLREKDGNSRPATATGVVVGSSGEVSDSSENEVPAFDVEEMKKKRAEWERRSGGGSRVASGEFVEGG
jgi:hypothetical protein